MKRSFLLQFQRLLVYRAKRLLQVELVGAFLQSISEMNPKLNAHLTVGADEAMASAQRAETAVIRLWDEHELSLNKTDFCAICRIAR